MHVSRTTPSRVGAFARLVTREFTTWPLYAAIAFSLLVFLLAYQAPQGAKLFIDVGAADRTDTPFLGAFYEAEATGDASHKVTFRWTGAKSSVVVPGVGRDVPLSLALSVADRPPTAPPAVLTVTINSSLLQVIRPTAGFNTYTLEVPSALNTRDDLTIGLQGNAFSPGGGDTRRLGVPVDAVQLQARGATLVRPPTYVIIWLLFTLLLLFLTIRLVGFTSGVALVCTAGAAALMAVVLVFARYELTLFAVPLGVVILSCLALALVMPPLVRWTMARLRVPIEPSHLKWLMAIYLLAFAIKAGGMMHPQFVELDQLFRAHQVQEMVGDFPAFWDKYQHVTTADEETGTIHSRTRHTMLGQWNLVVPFPYSPVGYFELAPFGWLWPDGNIEKIVAASDTMLAALSGTIAFALYAIARKGLGSGMAGIIAAAISQFAPISYLHFSDGAYPYIWANWVTIVYIMAAILLVDRASRPIPFIVLTLLSALTFLSHTAIVFFALVFVLLLFSLYWLVKRWERRSASRESAGGGHRVPPLRPLFLSFVAGGIVSLVYYGGYIWPLLTVSIPTLISKAAMAGVGQQRQFLGDRLLSGFWPQVAAHFATWPAILALVGLVVLASYRRVGTAPLSPTARVDNPYRAVTVLFLLSWALTFLLFSVLDLRVNLLQRHMIFALPLISLLAGYALARLEWKGGMGGVSFAARLVRRSGLYVALLLIGYLFVVSTQMWLDRTLRYVLPPGSG